MNSALGGAFGRPLGTPPPSVNATSVGYGVGTTSPGEFFEVSRSQNANTVMRVVNATATGAAQAVVAAVGGSVTTRMVSSPAAGISIVGTQSNHPLVFATNDAERARIDTSGNFYLNSGYGSAGIAYGCRAWVNFNGTGTVAIRASGNVTSITDNGVGDYTVNFTTAMPDANYAVSLMTGNSASGATNMQIRDASTAPTTGAVRIFNNWNGTGFDQSIVCAAIFR